MQVIEIEDNLATKISELAKSENKSLTEFVNLSLRELLERIEKRREIMEKERQAIEAYRRFPIQPDEFEIEEEQMEKFWEQI